MPSAATPSLQTRDHDMDEDDTGDLETPKKIPLVLPSEVDSAARNAVCLHQVIEYEQHLRFAQLQDSLTELCRVHRI